jgi:hypothetical protein
MQTWSREYEFVAEFRMETSELKLAQTSSAARRKMPLRSKLLFYLVAWLIVLMPFLFWRSTWFGRPLNDRDLGSYLKDDHKPRHIQHALVQMGDRMSKGDTRVRQWYPDLVRLATYPVEEVRNTDAWVMGQDASYPEFHRALLTMLDDQSPLVRGNAALALVRFADPSGRAQIISMLQPMKVAAPTSGVVTAVARSGEPANHGTVLVKLQSGNDVTEVRAAISGRIKTISAQPGARVTTGMEVAVLNPGSDQVWEALRALYVIGTADDLAYVTPYERETPEYPQRVAQQAIETERAIRQRAPR